MHNVKLLVLWISSKLHEFLTSLRRWGLMLLWSRRGWKMKARCDALNWTRKEPTRVKQKWLKPRNVGSFFLQFSKPLNSERSEAWSYECKSSSVCMISFMQMMEALNIEQQAMMRKFSFHFELLAAVYDWKSTFSWLNTSKGFRTSTFFNFLSWIRDFTRNSISRKACLRNGLNRKKFNDPKKILVFLPKFKTRDISWYNSLRCCNTSQTLLVRKPHDSRHPFRSARFD